jgi:hypothetical protein
MNPDGSFILISWEALAFVFTALPGIVAVAYCYECGKEHRSPTLSGYYNMLKMAKKAKSEAYKKTADTIIPTASRKSGSTLLAWVFILIVALVGPGPVVTVIMLLLSIPASVVSYCVGRNG